MLAPLLLNTFYKLVWPNNMNRNCLNFIAVSVFLCWFGHKSQVTLSIERTKDRKFCIDFVQGRYLRNYICRGRQLIRLVICNTIPRCPFVTYTTHTRHWSRACHFTCWNTSNPCDHWSYSWVITTTVSIIYRTDVNITSNRKKSNS